MLLLKLIFDYIENYRFMSNSPEDAVSFFDPTIKMKEDEGGSSVCNFISMFICDE